MPWLCNIGACLTLAYLCVCVTAAAGRCSEDAAPSHVFSMLYKVSFCICSQHPRWTCPWRQVRLEGRLTSGSRQLPCGRMSGQIGLSSSWAPQRRRKSEVSTWDCAWMAEYGLRAWGLPPGSASLPRYLLPQVWPEALPCSAERRCVKFLHAMMDIACTSIVSRMKEGVSLLGRRHRFFISENCHCQLHLGDTKVWVCQYLCLKPLNEISSLGQLAGEGFWDHIFRSAFPSDLSKDGRLWQPESTKRLFAAVLKKSLVNSRCMHMCVLLKVRCRVGRGLR